MRGGALTTIAIFALLCSCAPTLKSAAPSPVQSPAPANGGQTTAALEAEISSLKARMASLEQTLNLVQQQAQASSQQVEEMGERMQGMRATHARRHHAHRRRRSASATATGGGAEPDAEPSEPALADQTAEALPAPTAPIAVSGAYCAVVGARLSAADCDAAVKLNSEAVEGHLKAKVPPTMYKGEPQYVRLAIGAPGSAEQEAEATVKGGGPGQVLSYPAKIGRRMKAELVGEGFDVKLVGGDQAVQDLNDGVQTWIWQVTPKDPGNRTLYIKTAVVFQDEHGVDHLIGPTAKSYSVQVTVRPLTLGERAKQVLAGIPWWLNAVTAIVTAAAALVTAIIGFPLLSRTFRRSRSPARAAARD